MMTTTWADIDWVKTGVVMIAIATVLGWTLLMVAYVELERRLRRAEQTIGALRDADAERTKTAATMHLALGRVPDAAPIDWNAVATRQHKAAVRNVAERNDDDTMTIGDLLGGR